MIWIALSHVWESDSFLVLASATGSLQGPVLPNDMYAPLGKNRSRVACVALGSSTTARVTPARLELSTGHAVLVSPLLGPKM